MYSFQTSKSLCQKSSFSDILGVAPKSNFSFELVKSAKICSTSTNPKTFGTEEKTNNVVFEIEKSGN